MKGSEFLAAYAGKPYQAWEAAALDLARQGGAVAWPTVPVRCRSDRHEVLTWVSSDVFAIGTIEDHLRLPLTCTAAQQVADLSGAFLPTVAICNEIWRQAPLKLTPVTSGQLALKGNQGANLAQYGQHDAAVQAQVARAGSPLVLTAGQKKDVVIGNIWKPGKLLIYGWFWPDVEKLNPHMSANPRESQPIQPYSNEHGDFWVDYSHGARLVAPDCHVDGVPTKLQAVLSDPELSRAVSHEGPLKMTRYPTPGKPVPVATGRVPNVPNLVDLGLQRVREEQQGG